MPIVHTMTLSLRKEKRTYTLLLVSCFIIEWALLWQLAFPSIVILYGFVCAMRGQWLFQRQQLGRPNL